MFQETTNTNHPLTWKLIGQAIIQKSQEDYRQKVVPAIDTGRTKVGSFIEDLGRRIQADNNN